jgi:C1A family cysteine protease
MPEQSEKVLGGHAVTLVGYDDTKGTFKVRNSWSAKWGDKGYCYFPYDYITDSNLCSDFWTVQKINDDE